MKIIIAVVIIFLFLLTVAFVTLIFDKGGFDWSLLSVAFSSVVIAIVNSNKCCHCRCCLFIA